MLKILTCNSQHVRMKVWLGIWFSTSLVIFIRLHSLNLIGEFSLSSKSVCTLKVFLFGVLYIVVSLRLPRLQLLLLLLLFSFFIFVIESLGCRFLLLLNSTFDDMNNTSASVFERIAPLICVLIYLQAAYSSNMALWTFAAIVCKRILELIAEPARRLVVLDVLSHEDRFSADNQVSIINWTFRNVHVEISPDGNLFFSSIAKYNNLLPPPRCPLRHHIIRAPMLI